MSPKIVAVAAALFVLAAACGGSDSSDNAEGVASLSGAGDEDVIAVPQPEEDVEEPTQEEALLAFTACLRENGIDIEDPTVDADGTLEFRFRGGATPGDADFDREAARAARDACADNLEGVTLGFGRGDNTEFQDMLFEYAACMRDNGYEMPDPDFGNLTPGGGGDEPGTFRGPFADIDPDDPDFVTASEACGDILSGFGPGGNGGVVARPGGAGRAGGGGNG